MLVVVFKWNISWESLQSNQIKQVQFYIEVEKLLVKCSKNFESILILKQTQKVLHSVLLTWIDLVIM